MLDAFGPGIWLAPGDPVAVMGFRYPTRMTVLRQPDGGLILWSPVALSDPLVEAVTALGEVRHLIAPNHLHHLFLSEWIAAFPDATVHAAPGLAGKRPDLRLDTELGETPPAALAETLDLALIRGNAITTEAAILHRESATVLVCDLLQQFDADWFHGWRRVIARADRMVSPVPAMPRKFRLAFTRRRDARPGVQRLLGWPAAHLIVAHGAPVMQDASAILRREFGWLAG